MSRLYCLVCDDHYFGKTDWLHHLSQDAHQKLARNAFLKEEAEMDQNGRNEKCLVVFTLIPLTSETACQEVLEYFSKLIGGNGEALPLPTNFIWWVDRPYIGILQFKNMSQVEEVLKALDVREGSSSLPKIRIGRRHHQSIHVKAGFRMPMLEWRGLLPPINSPPPPPSHQTSLNDSPVKIKEEPESDDDDSIDNHRFFKRGRLMVQQEPRQDNHFAKPPPPPRLPVARSLQDEYQIIQNMMLIPDSKNRQMSHAMASLKTTLSTLDPLLQVAPFRKGCLQLNYPRDLDHFDNQQEDLLAYVYTLGDHTAFEVDAKVKDFLTQTDTQFQLVEEHCDHWKLFHLRTNTKITLVTPRRKRTLAEVQVCRLMEYLCQFDPRCHSLMTLACYWVTINEINLAWEDNISSALPAQYIIQWLVLFFLNNKQFIPSVREVLELNPVDYLRDEVTGENIGFLSDPGYVEKWRKLRMHCKRSQGQMSYGHGIPVGPEKGEQFILNALRFFHKFLGVTGRILGKKHPWIFNTVDGVQMAVSKFLEMDLSKIGEWGGGVPSRWRNVRREEAERLKGALMRERERMMRNDGGGVYMTHPFLWAEKIWEMSGEELRILAGKFVEGARKLDGFFERVGKKGGDGVAVKKALEMEGGLEYLLRI